MIQIQQIKVSLDYTQEDILSACEKKLNISREKILTYQIIKKSLDARKKPELFWNLQLAIDLGEEETKILKKQKKDISSYLPKQWKMPELGEEELNYAPVIVGAGPAGLFCAYVLAKAGFQPILIERGKAIQNRKKDVSNFWESNLLHKESNVQFGEGGAGTFSDGKLTTLVKDKLGRNRFVLETFVRFGAPEEILIEQKPHIGTDILEKVVENMRKELISLGTQVFFSEKLTGLTIHNHKLSGIETSQREISSEVVVLAIGHSARDTMEMLAHKKIEMESKEFAVGFRIQHPQDWLNETQYGRKHHQNLKAASYKLATKLPNQRGVYSFCMCPGGYVVNASSEEGMLAVNGMSYYDRGSTVANSAIIVSVGRNEFDFTNPLSGMYYQRKLEEKAYHLGKGSIPIQKLQDFDIDFSKYSHGVEFEPKIKGKFMEADLTSLFSKEINNSFVQGMDLFQRKITGFADGNAILAGVESRTSSPVRIVRNLELESPDVAGLYPCGEGAGYAGGIMSAAMDGIKIAEKIIEKYHPTYE